jgi:hypothetical protein
MTIHNDKGRPFLVRVVLQGERYGLDDCLTHDKPDPLIEFYDRTYAGPQFGERGQFVSRYCARTLADHRHGAGLCLDGGISCWTVDGTALLPVLMMAQAIARPPL